MKMKNFLVVLLMLRYSLLFAAWSAPVPKDKLPFFSLPKMSRPPVIDGKIDPEEWKEATAVSGVGGCTSAILIARPTTYYLAWDENHLYWAVRTWVPPNYKPRVGGREPGSASAFDDGCEFHFQPMGKNVAPGRTNSSFKFMINCLGVDGELERIAVGQQFKNWNPHFRRVWRLTPAGSAPNGGRWWECEIAATTEDFELVKPNQPGDQWKFMLGFNHLYTGWTQARIAAISSYFDPGGYPVGVLTENTPAVQMLMEDIPGPSGGKAAMKINIYNPARQTAEIKLLVLFTDTGREKVATQNEGQPADLIRREETIKILPGESYTWKLDETISGKLGQRLGTIEVNVTEKNRLLFRYFTFFQEGYPREALEPAPAVREVFPLKTTFNPMKNSLLLVADTYYLDEPEKVKEVTYRIFPETTQQAMVTGCLTTSQTYYFRKLIQLPPLKPGKYLVEATLTQKDGARIGPVQTSFTKLDESKVFADWWNTKLGDTERIIKPFTGVKKEGNNISVWGRRYRLNCLGLPEKIISQGQPVTASPARIVVSSKGKKQKLEFSGRPFFTEIKPWRVSFTGRAKGANLEFQSKGWVEQDGLVYLELTYRPEGKMVFPLEGLQIEFPLSPQQAECLLCLGSGGNYAARTTMLLPPDKKGRIWTTLDTGKNGSRMVVGSFYPCVWLGNEQRGLLWWADNDRGWVPDDALPAHEVIRTEKEVILRQNIIGTPFMLDKERTIIFSYMASPFRPLVKGWRVSIWSADGTFEGPNKEVRDPRTKEKIVDGWNWLTPPSRNPADWGKMWAAYKKIADERIRKMQPYDPSGARNGYGSTVHTSIPLHGYGWKSPDETVTSYFAADWEGDSWNKTEQDYFLWIAHRAFGEGGLRTIYWDIFFVKDFTAIQTGLPYQLPDGRIQPGFNGFNLRRFMMRMYSLMESHGLVPGSQVSHATNCYPLVACPWMDAILDGEYHAITDDSGMDWVDGYPVERMRAMSVPQNFGTVISWMNLISIKDPVTKAKAVRGFIDYPRLYDTWSGGGGYQRVPETALDWGLNEEKTVYVPFWRNNYVSCEDKDILVSLWKLPDRVALLVFNYNREKTKDATIRIDLKKLNLIPRLPWQEFIGIRDLVKDTKEPPAKLDFYAQTVTVPALSPHTGRLIGIRLY